MDSVVDYIIRPLYPEEIHLLRDFLYEAIFIPEGVEPLPRDVVDLPELKLYIQDFGKKQDDCCLVVEYDGKVVGAVWTRIMNDYGHVDDETPSLSISLYKEYRNKGMGRQLMKEMMKLLESKGYHHVSLSVQKDNYAVRMYLKLGFTIMKETEEEFIMVRDITKEASNYQRFLSGEYCNRLDSEVLNMIIQTRELLSMLDNITLSEEERTALFVRMLGKVGQHSSIGRNFTCQCGKHIFIGEKTIINDNCTLMDENYIYIGSKVLIAPHVQFYTATHPVCFEERFVEDWNENSGELFFRTKALPITLLHFIIFLSQRFDYFHCISPGCYDTWRHFVFQHIKTGRQFICQLRNKPAHLCSQFYHHRAAAVRFLFVDSMGKTKIKQACPEVLLRRQLYQNR